ncbi:MAG: hypothetical protein WD970_01230 [Patescibacteria group bacterium]
MDTNTKVGLIILGVAVLLGLFFARKFIGMILLVAVIAASAWYFYFR